MLLADRVAFVTDAGSGIGRAIAELFAREGARIATFDRSRHAGDDLVAALGSAGAPSPVFVCGDVRVPAEVEQAVEAVVAETGRIDVVVNCAGVREIGDAYTMPTTSGTTHGADGGRRLARGRKSFVAGDTSGSKFLSTNETGDSP